MNKKLLLLQLLTVSLVITTLVAVSAGNYYYPTRTYFYPTPQYYQSSNYYNAPTITERTSSSNENSLSYNRNSQGRLFERNSRYDEFLKIGKSGRVTRTVSATESERYIGGVQIENTLSQSKANSASNFNNIPTNPTIYNGDSYYRALPKYNYYDYSQDSYTKPYYYMPRYDSKGYYNWRY